MSFAPVYNEHSRALILGTWPSPKSREMSFYYGHPQNRFWPMLAALTGEPVPAREDIEAKKQIILRHGLALWDTLESCTITGASDASIRDVVPNDIAGLLAKAPIEAVFCNGATAYKIYTKYLEPVSGIPAVRLPSTSPANAACRPEKLRRKNCRTGFCLECRADLPNMPGAPLSGELARKRLRGLTFRFQTCK